MPYIPYADRPAVEPLSGRLANSEGELNYQITRLCHWFAESHGHNYATYNAIIGALECAKLEVYRRRIAQYEESKLNENGDVYP